MKQAQKQAYAKHRSNITNSQYGVRRRNSKKNKRYISVNKKFIRKMFDLPVNDGRLTITSLDQSNKTRLCFIKISSGFVQINNNDDASDESRTGWTICSAASVETCEP